jgi:hypothetical protein
LSKVLSVLLKSRKNFALLDVLMSKPTSGVNVEQVKRNAIKDGISLSQIAIFYKELTESEKATMREQNLIASESESGVIGRFTQSGDVLFHDKVDGFHYLGA